MERGREGGRWRARGEGRVRTDQDACGRVARVVAEAGTGGDIGGAWHGPGVTRELEAPSTLGARPPLGLAQALGVQGCESLFRSEKSENVCRCGVNTREIENK